MQGDRAVARHESPRQTRTDPTNDGLQRTGCVERRVGKQHRRERNVVGRLGADGRGPVDDHDVAVVLHEKVEGMEVAMADHRGPLGRPACRQRSNGRSQIGSTERVGARLKLLAEVLDRPRDGWRHCGNGCAHGFGVQTVDTRHHRGELDRQASEQPGCAAQRGDPVEIAERRGAGSKVHDGPDATQIGVDRSGEAYVGSGKAHLGDGLLDGDLLRAHRRVGRDSKHDVARAPTAVGRRGEVGTSTPRSRR